MKVADEIGRADLSDYDLAVLAWIKDWLLVEPTMDNRTLHSHTKREEGNVGAVVNLRARARAELGIERKPSGGTLDVAKFVAGGGRWDAERSAEVRTSPHWKFLNDPHAPPDVPKPPAVNGRRRSKPVAQALAEAEAAGADAHFAFAVSEVRRAMLRRKIHTLTVTPGTLDVAFRIVVSATQDHPPVEESADGPVGDEAVS